MDHVMTNIRQSVKSGKVKASAALQYVLAGEYRSVRIIGWLERKIREGK